LHREGDVLFVGRRRKKTSSKGNILEGTFSYRGIPVDPGSNIFSLAVKDLSLADSIMLGKCVALTECSYIGNDVDSYTGNSNVMEYMLRDMKSPKYETIDVDRDHYRAAPSAGSHFKHHVANQHVRTEIRQFVPVCYWDDYDGAYVNTDLSYAGIVKLYEKLRGIPDDVTGAIIDKLSIDDEDFRVLFIMLLERIRSG
jgi:hypothetical protein